MATRILLQNGFEAANLSGGFTTWQLYHPEASELSAVGNK